jgi:hypothetical protein
MIRKITLSKVLRPGMNPRLPPPNSAPGMLVNFLLPINTRLLVDLSSKALLDSFASKIPHFESWGSGVKHRPLAISLLLPNATRRAERLAPKLTCANVGRTSNRCLTHRRQPHVVWQTLDPAVVLECWVYTFLQCVPVREFVHTWRFHLT